MKTIEVQKITFIIYSVYVWRVKCGVEYGVQNFRYFIRFEIRFEYSQVVHIMN